MNNQDRSGEFLALLFRQKDINRWGLMRNVSYETLSEHSYEVAVISHILAIIGNTYFNRSYQPYKIATAALYHDMSEILTGDLPTPVKYYNDEIKIAYKKIENIAENIMLDLLPDKINTEYQALLELDENEKKIIKSADKICAYIKCIHELSAGNKEFATAKETVYRQIESSANDETRFFIDNYLDAFTKPLDDITLGGQNG